MAWISGSPFMARPLISNTPSGMKLESNKTVSAVSKAITHRYTASTTASRPVMGGLRTAGRENGDVMVQARGFCSRSLGWRSVLCWAGSGLVIYVN